MSQRAPRVQPRAAPRAPETSEDVIAREATRDLRRPVTRVERDALLAFVDHVIRPAVTSAMRVAGTKVSMGTISRAPTEAEIAAGAPREIITETIEGVTLSGGPLAPYDNPDPMRARDVEAILVARDRIRRRIEASARFADDLDHLPRLLPILNPPEPTEKHAHEAERAEAQAWRDASPALRDAVAAADERVRALLDVLGEVERIAHYATTRGKRAVGHPIDGAARLLPELADTLDRTKRDDPSSVFPWFAFSRRAAERIVDAAARAIDPTISRTWASSRAAARNRERKR